MIPLQMDLVWRRNAPEPVGYALTDVSAAGVVVPVDLTGYTFRLDVRLYPGAAGPALASLGMAAAGQPGFVIDDAVAGQFTFTPPSAAQLSGTSWPAPPDVTTGRLTGLAYDCLLIGPDGVAEPFWAGRLTLDSGVTRL